MCVFKMILGSFIDVFCHGEINNDMCNMQASFIVFLFFHNPHLDIISDYLALAVHIFDFYWSALLLPSFIQCCNESLLKLNTESQCHIASSSLARIDTAAIISVGLFPNVVKYCTR